MAQPGITVAGNPAPIRVSVSRDVARTDAPETRYVYRGTNLAVGSAFTLLASGAARASFRQDGASASAEIVYKEITAFQDVIEIDFNSVHREWWTAPAYAAFAATTRVNIIAAIERFNKEAAELDSPAAIAALFTNEKDVLNNNVAGAGDAFEDIWMNGETYLALLPVVTFTRNVSREHRESFVISNIGLVFSTAAIIAELPRIAQWAVSEVTNTVATNALQTLGWLKTGRYGVTSDGGAQYVQQFIFDSWPTARYTFV